MLLESVYKSHKHVHRQSRAKGPLVLCCLLALSPARISATGRSKEIIAYVFAKDRTLQPDEIDAPKLTRINYAFANIREGSIIEGFSHDAENFAVLTGLKRLNPHLKILVSVGGWTWSGGFSDMALTSASRRKFIDSAVEFVRKYHLDGLDIDWEYPGLPGIGNPYRPQDSMNYTALLKELRLRFNREQKQLARRLLTSIAAGASPAFLAQTEMGKVARYVDTVNLMSYDYYEPSSDRMTGHHAPLIANPADPRRVSADASVKAFLAAGVPARKLVLGVPFYGHAWSDVGEANHGLFQPGNPAKIDASYHNIVESLLTAGYIRYWDPVSSVPYLYNPADRIFITYEDVESVGLKSRYVRSRNLRGIMFWEYHADARGALLSAIHTVLN